MILEQASEMKLTTHAYLVAKDRQLSATQCETRDMIENGFSTKSGHRLPYPSSVTWIMRIDDRGCSLGMPISINMLSYILYYYTSLERYGEVS